MRKKGKTSSSGDNGKVACENGNNWDKQGGKGKWGQLGQTKSDS